MIAEIVLTIVIFALTAYIYLTNRSVTAEREKLLKLLMARNLKEVTDNEVMEKIIKNEPTESKPSDLVEMNPDDDIAFDNIIKDQLTEPR